jgi:hypothetical protein
MQPSILDACRHAPLRDLPTTSNGPFSCGCLLGLAPGGVCSASGIAAGAVSSYLAFSPLLHPRKDGAVFFLLHFPSPRGVRMLSGTLPCGVRTFLTAPPRKWCGASAAAWSPPSVPTHRFPVRHTPDTGCLRERSLRFRPRVAKDDGRFQNVCLYNITKEACGPN